MSVEIKVPRLGWSMEEGTFVEWLKRDGDFVEAGQPLFSIEGDKAIQDVEAIGSGILRIPPNAPENGDPVRVGVTLGFLVAAGEAIPAISGADSPEPTPRKPVPQPKPEVPHSKPSRPEKPGPEVPRPGTTPTKTPPPPSPAPEVPSPKTPEIPSPGPTQPEIAPAEPPQQEPGSPSFGRPSRKSLAATLGQPATTAVRPRISPRALRVATELGIDWQQAQGSGRSGRIRERDIRAVALALADTATTSSTVLKSTPNAAQAAIRRTIAARMTAGANQTAPVTLTTTADATNLVSLREQFKAATPSDTPQALAIIPGYLAFITKLAARALSEHPQLNQQWIDGRIETPDGIHIAIAVDTPTGLLAPVLRDVSSVAVRDIASRLQDLTRRAEAGTLSPADLTGGTFTITNLGAFGIDAFTPIINIPQCAILGLGRIEKRPAVVADQIVPRDQIVLSLTFDHRIVDGAPAAKFLATLRERIENPGPWLVS